MTIRDLIRDGYDIDAPFTLVAGEELVAITSIEHIPAANPTCPGKLAMIPRREVGVVHSVSSVISSTVGAAIHGSEVTNG
jgi:hypothetical protein